MRKDEKWKRLWKLDVLPRVRSFWWRVLRGILLVYATLTRRHVKVNSTCPVCKSASENMIHAMIECGHAKQFWTAARDILHLKLPRLHPDTWTVDILCDPCFNQGEREKIISIMSAIWDSRNRWAHDDVGYDPSKTILGIAETMSYLENKVEKTRKVGRPPCTWHGPEPGVVKLNSDGSIREESGRVGFARNHRGFRGAWCRTYTGISDPLIIETLAFRDAVVFAAQQGYERIICESDCEVLVCMWKGRAAERSVLAPIFGEVEDMLVSFQSFDFFFEIFSIHIMK